MTKNIWEKAAYYDDIKETHHLARHTSEDPIFRRYIRLLKSFNRDASVLDVGCGEGWLIEQLSKHLEGGIFTGIDVSEVGLSKASERKLSNATFLHYDGNSFPFSGERFDVVLSSFVFEHLSDPEKTFKEMTRVVKRGGVVIIACPNFGSPLFKSPCNKVNRLLLMVARFINELKPRFFYSDVFHWRRVEPIELPEDIHISDYDTLCEPNLSSFKKYLDCHKDQYSVVELDSLWDSFDYENNSVHSASFFRKKLVACAQFLGLRKLFRFQYFGSFFFAAIKKI